MKNSTVTLISALAQTAIYGTASYFLYKNDYKVMGTIAGVCAGSSLLGGAIAYKFNKDYEKTQEDLESQL